MSSLQESFPVQVAVYDLSHGVARGLSAQFLGPNFSIDAIPHSGVLVYGMEYFYGGGIQCETPSAFRRATGIQPMQVLTVGRTRVTRDAFEAWCRQQAGTFNAASYDLLHHNCNTFADVALRQGLKLSIGVPQWILDVPRRFLSSPMGQMVRPMLENMQLGRVDGAELMTSTAPFAGAAPALNAVTPAAATAPNPWAQIPAASSTPTAPKSSTRTIRTATLHILQSHNKPLLANETKTVSICVEKLVPLVTGNGEADDLRTMGKALAEQRLVSAEQVSRVASILLQCLESGQKTTFTIMLLRLVVLQHAEFCQSCVEWIVQNLPEPILQGAASRAMSWLTLSNVVAQTQALLEQPKLESLQEWSLRDISLDAQPRVEVRQAAAAFLYNTVLTSSMQLATPDTELSDTHVSILCACMDALDRETDDTAAMRRLLVVARMLVPLPKGNGPNEQKHEGTALLMKDLGFRDVLTDLARDNPQGKIHQLAKEVLSVLS